ncbi:unnamed protein product [Gongylonema pulchrum]|uniref:HECW1_helix domain-containing protein n=1 Tax=Gongylonema pulchrum TaxID=637853 RepID=A0A183D3B9_9BILA|nr:unnamed protein product [Gongylonema pulchrum]
MLQFDPSILQPTPSSSSITDNIRHVCVRRTVIRGEPTTSASHDCSPVKFLQRGDFISLLHENQARFYQCLYNRSRYLKHIVHRIRKDGAKFERFSQNRELVQFLNSFADKTLPLPEGWQLNGGGMNEQVSEHESVGIKYKFN